MASSHRPSSQVARPWCLDPETQMPTPDPFGEFLLDLPPAHPSQERSRSGMLCADPTSGQRQCGLVCAGLVGGEWYQCGRSCVPCEWDEGAVQLS